MALGKNFTQTYGQAEKAYMRGDYESAATIIDGLVQEYPQDPSAALLRGHIYCYGLHQYDLAQAQYQTVLDLEPNQDFIDYANSGIEYAISANGGFDSGNASSSEDSASNSYDPQDFTDPTLEDLALDPRGSFDDFSESEATNFISQPGAIADSPFTQFNDDFDQFSDDFSSPSSNSPFDQFSDAAADPFSFSTSEQEFGMSENSGNEIFGNYQEQPFELDNPALFADIEEDSGTFLMQPSGEIKSQSASPAIHEPFRGMAYGDHPDNLTNSDSASENRHDLFSNQDNLDEPLGSFDDYPEVEEETLLMSGEDFSGHFNSYAQNYMQSRENGLDTGAESTYGQPSTSFDAGSGNGFTSRNFSSRRNSNEDFGGDDMSGGLSSEPMTSDFLEEFDVFGADDDLSAISNFDMDDSDNLSSEPGSMNFGYVSSGGNKSNNFDQDMSAGSKISSEEEIFSLGTDEQMPSFALESTGAENPLVMVDQGFLAPMENAPLYKKQWIVAAATGIVSAVAVAIVSFGAASTAPPEGREVVVPHLRLTGGLMTLAAGVASFGTAWFLGQMTSRQIRRSTDNLQAQFEAVSQGNLSATATVFSEDEFGKLATGFNQMSRVILTTTSEAQRKAAEQEQAKEDLQRQVIRLLDDVEGAARGDLTVQAEVTADVLGAVADSFNLTIQNLREIVQQVTRAARQVTKGANDNESFARSLSSDALRQAEELAVTLNSVKVMTDSIQRVAESAREAEEVARTASTTALKGGEAVERTVAGILQIRETVAETTRKVKRLAESSQEISKIVAAISAIASRTNLLALNASIEAARAGEAGKGFAIVADEVRQLADRSAKSLREIEQIVLQIQSETSSVMTAMEEGVTQVIEGTKRAEQAKRALEDIIQVSNRIDALVRSITADTVEQTLTSRAVTQVMQSVELTAQETSQEAQRVSGSLQNLVSVARDLLTSVERFRIEAPDGK
jgi:twitching motility protein PilJ